MVVWTTPPGIGIGPHPGPWLIQTPLTGVEEYRLPCLVQSSRLQSRMTQHATIAWSCIYSYNTVLHILKVILGTINLLYTQCCTAPPIHLVVWSIAKYIYTLANSCGRIE